MPLYSSLGNFLNDDSTLSVGLDFQKRLWYRLVKMAAVASKYKDDWII